ncbi:MAG: glycosyltransferase [Leptolyngbyaceae cyanobacterium bins.349]|nr:glycosyltransferase [Leptolyngbyaceae cyanobacterium bins.349]
MTHFGIICPPYPGHINPQAALGRELRSRGHRVTLLQISDVASQVLAEGLEFCPIGESRYQPGTLAKTFIELAKLSEIAALHYSVAFCREMAEIICHDAPTAISRLGIDALITDQLEPAGETVAAGLGLPSVCISCGQAIHRRADVPPFFSPWSYRTATWAKARNQLAYFILDRSCQPILRVINEYRDRWNLPPYRHIYATETSLAHICQQPELFDFPYPKPDCLHYVGPLRTGSPQPSPFPYDRLTGQPLIYASLGSLQNTNYPAFQAIAAACYGLDVQLVIAHGGGMTPAMAAQLPGTPLVLEYVPQFEVLARASLTITHGGMNTLMDAFSHGVPVIAIPITFEQPGNATRVKWTNTGQVIPISQLTSARLRTAIQQVLGYSDYQQNARRMQRAIHAAGGVSRAAEIIETVIRSRQPQASLAAYAEP